MGSNFGVAFDVSLWAGAHVFCNPVSNCFGLAMLLFGEIFSQLTLRKRCPEKRCRGKVMSRERDVKGKRCQGTEM